MQEQTPRLQGRVNAASTAMVITPQTVSIAIGAALISVISYRLLLFVMAAVISVCALWLLARPASEGLETGGAGEELAAGNERVRGLSP
jgi:hypothetical protein